VITGGISSSKRFTEDLSNAISSVFFQQYFWDDPNNLGKDEHKPQAEFEIVYRIVPVLLGVRGRDFLK